MASLTIVPFDMGQVLLTELVLLLEQESFEMLHEQRIINLEADQTPLPRLISYPRLSWLSQSRGDQNCAANLRHSVGAPLAFKSLSRWSKTSQPHPPREQARTAPQNCIRGDMNKDLTDKGLQIL